ncbi:hypothetical protein H0H87_007049, partial [Tephrocybe sp. NHM501043]
AVHQVPPAFFLKVKQQCTAPFWRHAALHPIFDGEDESSSIKNRAGMVTARDNDTDNEDREEEEEEEEEEDEEDEEDVGIIWGMKTQDSLLRRPWKNISTQFPTLSKAWSSKSNFMANNFSKH